MTERTCFVVMGYGRKPDFETGRTLDLDKSYRNMIKPAVEACGLRCVRSDEVRHSGVIDVVMYQRLLDADLVIADLSTSNPNALYELGVRHALRPHATIVIAENRMRNPFDVNHVVINNYQHMGDGIDYDEVVRFRDSLEATVKAVLANPTKDSPVYTYLAQLEPPCLPPKSVEAIRRAVAAATTEPTVGLLVAQANDLIARGQFGAAKTVLEGALALRPEAQNRTLNDDYLIQRLALATYKSKLPSMGEALKNAATHLERLHPRTSNDPETLGLYGAVRKRLWDATDDVAHLDAAIRSYERGYFLCNDYYNGINLAYLLNVRSASAGPADAIADYVRANRIRREVVDICLPLDAEVAPGGRPPNADTTDLDRLYWIRATLAEATLGLGASEESERWVEAANAVRSHLAEGSREVPQWMRSSAADQLDRLRALLKVSPLKRLES